MKNKFHCILLVDDNVADNRYNQIIMEEMDITEKVLVAASAQEAINILSQQETPHPDLILLDINMPGMNGWEFLEAYKNLYINEKSTSMIVVLTTSMNPEDRKKAAQITGIAAYEIKPLTQHLLQKMLLKYLPGTGSGQ